MGLTEIVAVPMARNLRSQAVMRRIGMTSDPAEGGPAVNEGPLLRHLVYRKPRDPEYCERLRRAGHAARSTFLASRARARARASGAIRALKVPVVILILNCIE
jgi:hypothetical protein